MDEQSLIVAEEKSHALCKKILDLLEQLLDKINHHSVTLDYCDQVVTEIIEGLDKLLRFSHHSVRDDQDENLAPKIYDLTIWLFSCT